jgi:hypothetical protein
VSKYRWIKANAQDWDEQIAAELKISIKAWCLKKAMLKADRASTMERITAEINEFVEAFDDTETEQAIAEKYRQELTAFANEAYDRAVRMVGNLTPYMFAQALVKPALLTKAQRDNLGNLRGMEIAYTDDAAQRILQTIPDFTEEGARRATAGNTYYKEIHKSVTEQMVDYTEFKQAAKRPYLLNVNQRNIVEMGIRFAKYQEQKRQLIADGVRLVYVPPHANCSKRCQPYQGKLYSLDGTRGAIDGRQFIPIEEVAEKKTVQGKRDPSRTYAAGLFAYNCRHTMQAYEDGMKFEVIPDKVIDKQREIEATQREMEREIRALREKHALYMEVCKTSRNKSLEAERIKVWHQIADKRKAYRAFCAKNKIPRYDDRLKIVAGEDIYKRTIGRKDPNVINQKIPRPQ